MPYGIILRYSLRALAFGAAAGLIWLAARLLCVKRPLTRRDGLWLLAVVYVAMVLEIIGLRIGLVTIRFMGGKLRLCPLDFTLSQWRAGVGPFIYHVGGNMMWFMPLGALLPKLFPKAGWFHALLAGLALSLLVECMQYVLGTGVSDIDDVLLNTLGALTGYMMHAVFNLNRRRA